MDIVTNLKERSEWKDGISYREQAALQRLMLTGTLDNAAYNWIPQKQTEKNWL